MLLSFVSFNLAAQEYEKDQFVDDVMHSTKEYACTLGKFLECTGDSTELCRMQMEFVVMPHCAKSRFADLSNMLSQEEADKVSRRFSECVAIAYPTLNMLDMAEFGQCMTDEKMQVAPID